MMVTITTRHPDPDVPRASESPRQERLSAKVQLKTYSDLCYSAHLAQDRTK